jgi:hypothetical protein
MNSNDRLQKIRVFSHGHIVATVRLSQQPEILAVAAKPAAS